MNYQFWTIFAALLTGPVLQIDQFFKKITRPGKHSQFANWNMAIEIVDLPIENGDFPVRYVSLPEGNPPFSHGFSYGFPIFPWVFPWITRWWGIPETPSDAVPFWSRGPIGSGAE